MRSDCIQKGKCTKNYLAAGLRPDLLGELTVPQDSPLNLWEGGAMRKGEQAGRIKGGWDWKDEERTEGRGGREGNEKIGERGCAPPETKSWLRHCCWWFGAVQSIHCLITESIHDGSKIVFCNSRVTNITSNCG